MKSLNGLLLISCVFSRWAIVGAATVFPSQVVALQRKSRIYVSASTHAPNQGTCLPSTISGGASSLAASRAITSKQFEIMKLLSGGVAGTLASCITNPMEVIKTQLQSSSVQSGDLAAAKGNPGAIAREILSSEGVSGFFRGLPPTLVGIIPSRSVYFYAYSRTKEAVKPWFGEGTVANAIISGFAAGWAGNTVTNPIWLVKTRMQLLADKSAGQRAYSGYGECIKSIYKEEGIGGFYKGITASYWGCAEGCIQFVFYEKIKKNLIAKNNAERAKQGLGPTDDLPKLYYFTTAAVAKCIASLTTYPHEVARTRMREQARSGMFKYKGMWQTIGLIGKEEGRQGLYAGMGVHLAKVIPNSALMFLTYEIVNSWLGQFQISDAEDAE